MADNPYTPPTLSGYNANPPSDDGSQTAANEVAWVTHTDKIGDPLRNFSNAIDDAVLAGFAKTINTDADENNSVAGSIAYGASELTIATGSVAAVRSHHTIDTQNDDAADDLDTITVAGVNDGTVLMLRLANAARVVTLKDNTGNIQTKNNEDIVLDANIPTILLRVGTDWFEIQRPVVDNPFDQSLNKADSVIFASVGNGASILGIASDVDFTTSNPALSGRDADGVMIVGNGSTNSLGAYITYYGDTHATQASDFEFDSDGTTELHYDNSATTWDFQANDILTTGELGCSAITSSGNFLFTTANPTMLAQDTNGTFTLSSNTTILGGNIVLFGDTHATQAGDIEFKASTTIQANYDDSQSTWNFRDNIIVTTGNVVFGSTGGGSSGKFTLSFDGLLENAAYFRNTDTGNSADVIYNFDRNGTTTGTITHTDVATAYNTSSDYRLPWKDNRVEVTKPNILNVPIYDFPDVNVRGVLAHELEKFCPEAVTGKKDAVDDNGKPIYQQIDYSKTIPDLILIIKDMKKEINILKSKIT